MLVRALITNLFFMICLFRASLYRSSASEDELWMPTKGKARLRNIKAESSEHKKYYKQHSKKSPVLFIAGDILSAFMFLFFLRRFSSSSSTQLVPHLPFKWVNDLPVNNSFNVNHPERAFKRCRSHLSTLYMLLQNTHVCLGCNKGFISLLHINGKTRKFLIKP